MNILHTNIEGVFIIENTIFKDGRGSFIKPFNAALFKKYNLSTEFKENYYSVSNKNVIRGMHIQIPPQDHSKLVYVSKGSILDVVVDLRVNSNTYGQYTVNELSEHNSRSIYMPPGCAHGFLSLEDNTHTVYLQSAVYSKEHDTGIKFDSFGFNWGVKDPVVSERDAAFKDLSAFISPFV